MASCSEDSKVKIWDLRKGKALYSLYSHTGAVNSVDFSFAGDYFATGGVDKNLLFWKSNFYQSNTREEDMVPPKVKLINEKVVKLPSKVEVPDDQSMQGSMLRQSMVREKLGQEVHLLEPAGQGEITLGQSGVDLPTSQRQAVVEVDADDKINNNLDRIMGQVDKVLIMLKVDFAITRIWIYE
jgi:WD domain, G-beta repeat